MNEGYWATSKVRGREGVCLNAYVSDIHWVLQKIANKFTNKVKEFGYHLNIYTKQNL